MLLCIMVCSPISGQSLGEVGGGTTIDIPPQKGHLDSYRHHLPCTHCPEVSRRNHAAQPWHCQPKTTWSLRQQQPRTWTVWSRWTWLVLGVCISGSVGWCRDKILWDENQRPHFRALTFSTPTERDVFSDLPMTTRLISKALSCGMAVLDMTICLYVCTQALETAMQNASRHISQCYAFEPRVRWWSLWVVTKTNPTQGLFVAVNYIYKSRLANYDTIVNTQYTWLLRHMIETKRLHGGVAPYIFPLWRCCESNSYFSVKISSFVRKPFV